MSRQQGEEKKEEKFIVYRLTDGEDEIQKKMTMTNVENL